MIFNGKLLRCLLMMVFLSPILNLRTYADVNVWETLFEPTTYVKDLICDPDIPNRMYAISKVQFENGPTYYLPSISENEGRTWKPSFDGIGIDPLPEADRLISTPTGQFILFFIVRDSFEKFTRIYQSLDRGNTWSSYSVVDASLQTIGISPSDTDIWIAGGRTIDNIDGLFRSADSGKTWDFICDSGSWGSHHHVEFSLSNPDTVVVCKSAEFYHLIKSTDAGLTWSILPTLNWGWNSSWDVTIHPTNPDIMVAAILGPPKWTHFMCWTTDGGQTWPVFGPEENDQNGMGGAMAVHIDTRDPDIIYVHKIDGDNLWRSTNGGIDWELTLQDIGGGYDGKSDYPPRFIESPWDDNTVYTNIAGVYVSRDRGHSWSPTGQIGSLTLYVHPTDSNYIYSTAHYQSFFRSTDHGQTWQSAAAGIQFLYKLAPDDTICASRVEPQKLWIYCERSGHCGDGALKALFRSTDYGGTWEILPDLPGDSILSIHASRHIAERVFAIVSDIKDYKPTNYRIAVSDDGGLTWREVFIPGAVTLISMEEPNIDSMTWMVLGASATEYTFYRSNDDGASWASFGRESGFAPFMNAKKIITDPYNDSRVYVVSDKTWRSENLGDTWSEWKSAYGYDLILDPIDPKIIYSYGYRTVDGGNVWTDQREFFQIQIDSFDSNILYRREPGGIPRVTKMTISSKKPSIYMAGFGSSAITLGLPSLLQLYAFAQDPDPNDKVTSIELFYNGGPIGDRLSDESTPGSGLFYKLYDITPSASGTFNLQLRAKDRFGLLSDPWPKIKIKEGDKK